MVGSYEQLQEVAAAWPVAPSVSDDLALMLRTCRDLFAHSYFAYDFGIVAVVWSVLAVERALREAVGAEVGSRAGLTKLIGKAQAKGWLSRSDADALRAGATLRNRIVHAQSYGTFSPAMVAGALGAAHTAIAVLAEKSRQS